jgi:antitoxin component HigA of HigAB toxin-antitoxin module
MLDSETTRERVLLFQRLRELTAERMEQEIAARQWTLRLLEEKRAQTVERLSRRNITWSIPASPRRRAASK